MQTIFYQRNSDTEISSPGGEGSSKRSALVVGNNGGGKISCCFFGAWNSAPLLLYIPTYYHSIGRQVTKGHTKICFGATFRLDDEATQLAEHNKRTVCWCNQSQLRYSIIRVPQKYVYLDGVVLSIGQVILCVYSGKYYGRLNRSESQIAFFSCSSDVRVVLNCASLSRYSIEVAILFVHSNQNKPYPSLCETYQSPYN